MIPTRFYQSATVRCRQYLAAKMQLPPFAYRTGPWSGDVGRNLARILLYRKSVFQRIQNRVRITISQRNCAYVITRTIA